MASGSACIVVHPGPTSDHAAWSWPVGVFIFRPPFLFPINAGWDFMSFSGRFLNLYVSYK